MIVDEATLDLLLDLQHDLGKYLLLPLSLLPKQAGDEAVRAAVRRALQQTRKHGATTQSARTLWAGFDAELSRAAALRDRASVRALRDAVARALAWEQALDTDLLLERDVVQRDFEAVRAAIAALIGEVRGA